MEINWTTIGQGTNEVQEAIVIWPKVTPPDKYKTQWDKAIHFRISWGGLYGMLDLACYRCHSWLEYVDPEKIRLDKIIQPSRIILFDGIISEGRTTKELRQTIIDATKEILKDLLGALNE